MRDLGRKINEDIFLIFIDEEYPHYFEDNEQQFPTIIQDGFLIGYTAANFLLKKIHDSSTPSESLYIPVKYINWKKLPSKIDD